MNGEEPTHHEPSDRPARAGSATRVLRRGEMGAAVTGRKEAQEALAKERNLLRVVVDNLPDLIFAKDTEGRFVFANAACCRFLGMEAEDGLLGKTDFDFLAEDIAAEHLAEEREVMQSGRPMINREVSRVLSGGAFSSLLSTKVPWRDADGGIVGLVGINRDITDRRQAEEALRESESQLRAILDGSPDVIVHVDTDLRVLWANKAALAIAPRGVGQQCYKAYANRDEACESCPCRRAVETGRITTSIVHHSGPEDFQEERHWEVIGAPLMDATGKATGAIEISRDVTDRRRMEQQARRRQEQLAHAWRLNTMGEMASGIAHELNQPLAAITNYAETCLLAVQGGKAGTEKLLDNLGEIVGQAERAGEIIRRLRGFVRKQEGRLSLVDVNKAVKEVVHFVESGARLSGVQVRLDLAACQPTVVGDQIQMQQVILNLTRNALEAMNQGRNGERVLTIRTSPAANGTVEVAVTDTGRGVPDEAMHSLFEPFHSTKSNGLGLGLAISRSIVEARGGRLTATRNPDRGMTFRFTLPGLEGGESDAG